MSKLSPQSLIEQLQWRYAVKKFDETRTISPDDWSALEQTLVLTPSSFGLQPWRFVVITDPAIKAKLPAISWGQKQTQQCSHYVVFAARTSMTAEHIDRLIERTAEVRGAPIEALASYRGMMMKTLVPPAPGFEIRHWAELQAYIALGNFMTAAAMVGIDTCPMEGIERDKYDALLGLPAQGFATAVACAAGYRAADDRYSGMAKVRYPADEVIQRV